MLNPWPYLNFSILFQLNCLGVKDFVAFSQMKRGVNCLGVKMTKKRRSGDYLVENSNHKPGSIQG